MEYDGCPCDQLGCSGTFRRVIHPGGMEELTCDTCGSVAQARVALHMLDAMEETNIVTHSATGEFVITHSKEPLYRRGSRKLSIIQKEEKVQRRAITFRDAVNDACRLFRYQPYASDKAEEFLQQLFDSSFGRDMLTQAPM
eukprot:Sspe_Gene.21043::Locus_7817_Transcript_1_1_Confidence_1.000_Length_471::g.21043::m.21043